jgi:DNA-binding transcriptional LysR family regulator
LGTRLYEHGVVIRNALDAAHETAASTGDHLTGRVRVSVPNAFGESVASAVLLDFKRQHPAITLDVVFENRITDLIRDEVDIAVRPLSNPPDTLDAWDLGPLRITACASPDFAEQYAPIRHPDELAKSPIITATVLDRRLRLSAHRQSTNHEVFLDPTLTSHNFTFLHEGVKRGLGVGLMSDFIVEQDIADGTLVQYLEEWDLSMFGRRMYMLTMPSRNRPVAISRALEHLATGLGARAFHRGA